MVFIIMSKNYIISENQFKFIVENNKMGSFVHDYLDSQDWRTWDIGDTEFNVADGEFGKDLIRFRIQYSSIYPDHHFDVIYLSDYLVTKINKIFSTSNEDSIRMIIDWFNKKYNKNLSVKDFEWMDNEEDDEDYED